MNFPFPPAPPGYEVITYARAVLMAWSLLGVGVLVFRLRNWKSIQKGEIVRWWLAAGVSYVIALLATSRSVYDDNEWLLPIFVAAIGISVAGITTGLAKIYVEGTRKERGIWLASNGISALFFSLLLDYPVPFRHPIQASNHMRCKNNLKTVGLAMHNYHDDKREFPPAVNGASLVSWRVTLLPYLDQGKIYDRYRQDAAWNSADNLPLARDRMDILSCPANYYPKNAEGLWYTAYSMPTGAQSVGADPRGTKIGEIMDRISNTLLIVEACGTQIVWSEPRDVNIDSQPTGINLNGQRSGHSSGWLSSYHGHAAQVLLADGSVRLISRTTDSDVLKKLATIDGGEPVDDF